MLRETLTVVRDLPRLHHIASVMIRYGWGDLVRLLGIANILERAGRLLHHKVSSDINHMDTPVRIRLAMEELGPAFVKLGQLLSTRIDMFPSQWITEFEKLHNHVPPVSYDVLHPHLVEALGGDPNEIFAQFDPVPIAAASIAQVYRARLQNGAPVVVKIRRPGIEDIIHADLRILDHIARLLVSEIPDTRRYDPIHIIAQFRRSLQRELDLAREARTVAQFARQFTDDSTVKIPQIFWQYCSAQLNVQEELIGVIGVDTAKLAEAGLDPVVLSERGADAVLHMILEQGHFHADPHPGNVIFMPNNVIGMIDFGMIGVLTKTRRNQIVDLLHAFIDKDETAFLQVLQDWAGDHEADESQLAYEVAELMLIYDDLQLKDLDLAALLNDVARLLRDNNLVLPADLSLLFKTLITLEGLGRQLNPDFRMIDRVAPFIEQIILDRLTPQAMWTRGRQSVLEALHLLSDLPHDVSKLLRQARRGRLRIDFDLKRLDHFGHQLDRASNRITMGILTASLVVGSSIIMTVSGGPKLFGLPLFGLLGFLIAFVNSLWIIFSIWRSGKQ